MTVNSYYSATKETAMKNCLMHEINSTSTESSINEKENLKFPEILQLIYGINSIELSPN